MKYKLALTLAVATTVAAPAVAAPPAAITAKAKQSVEKGLNYLRSVQEADGSWSHYPATTALAVTAFLRNGRTEAKDPNVAKGIRFLLQNVKPNGAIYSDANPSTALPNYNTCLALVALSLTRNPSYKPTIQKAQQYLEKSQFDEEEGINPTDPMYGGVGYGSRPDRPDLSNLQTSLEALSETGAKKNSPVFKKAIQFLQRVQARRESNDQAWVKESDNDGGFIYDSKGRSMADEGGKPHSYGSMTYAGLKSYIYAGVSKTDPRAQAAYDWVRKHYSVTENPGLGQMGLYYYYHTMAKTLDVYGQKMVKDTTGKSHDWASDLATQIVKAQRPNGSWFNETARWWEDQPALVTSYSLIALSYCLK
jgi:squalene-hopene/tetraprenyl-beta-curcumene cyclase